MAHARTLSLEGATDLGAALAEAGKPRWGANPGGRWDVFLLGDGAATWGESDAYAISAPSPEDAPDRSSPIERASPAPRPARSTTSPARAEAPCSPWWERPIPAASRAHRARPLALEKIDVPGGSDILVAGRPKVIFPGQRLIIAGRGTPELGAPLAITVTDGGKPRTLAYKLDRPLSSRLAPRVYGQVAVAGLEELGAPTERLATAYAVYFRVTGRTTSLLMLESEEAYQRAGVKPPDPEPLRKVPAGVAIAEAIRDIGAALGDPRAGFLAWLDKLPRLPGMRFSPAPALREQIASLPAAAFTVTAPPLEPRLIHEADLPGPFRELLSIHQADYAAFTAEAERRRAAAGPADALIALSSLVEQSPGDAVLARDMAFYAIAQGLGGHAFFTSSAGWRRAVLTSRRPIAPWPLAWSSSAGSIWRSLITRSGSPESGTRDSAISADPRGRVPPHLASHRRRGALHLARPLRREAPRRARWHGEPRRGRHGGDDHLEHRSHRRRSPRHRAERRRVLLPPPEDQARQGDSRT